MADIIKFDLSENNLNKIIAYHGSNAFINNFDWNFLGTGATADEHGPGFYFSSSNSDAKGYGKFLYKCELTLKKVIEHNKPASKQEIISLIQQCPKDTLEIALSNWDENKNKAFQMLLNSILENGKDAKDQFEMVWADVYNFKSIPYIKNMVNVLHYDGIIIPKQLNIIHYIVFNPASIKILEITEFNGHGQKLKSKKFN